MPQIPMPSPNQTNYEGLRLPQRLAADAAPRRSARDADPDAVQQSVKNLTTHLGSTLQGEDLMKSLSLLTELMNIALPSDPDDDSDDADPDDDDDQVAAQDRRRRGVTGDRRFPTPEQVAGGEMGLAKPLRRGRPWVGDRATYLRVSDQMSKLFPNAVLPRQLG
jgi:hypothetical protein